MCVLSPFAAWRNTSGVDTRHSMGVPFQSHLFCLIISRKQKGLNTHMLQETHLLLRRRFMAGMFTNSQYKRGSHNRKQLNTGALSTFDKGDAFTEPSIYRNRSNASILAKLPRKVKQLRTEESLRAKMKEEGGRVASSSFDKRMMELDKSSSSIGSSKNDHEAATSSMLNRKDLGLGEFRTRVGNKGGSRLNRGEIDVSSDVIRAVHAKKERLERLQMQHPQAPNAKEYHRIFSEYVSDGRSDQEVERHQSRLAEEHGIYPTGRIDAYMLDDDGVFPSWVHKLPYSVRDRVKYGNMGLTEEDEAMRARLGRLPMDQRLREWERLKKAKKYLAAQEESLSPAELREAREGNKRFHWLQRKRQRRASMLRRLALRKPDQFEVWPSDAVDYSRRLSVIAQHVENGVSTHGRWPLDEEELAKSKLKRRQEMAERTFLKSSEEHSLAKGRRMDGNIARTLEAMDSTRAPETFKRLSRKAYANRVNAVKYGDQDAHGRNYKTMARNIKSPNRAYESIAEIALQQELRKEPLVHVKNPKRPDAQHWSQHQQESSYKLGMPNNRFGS